MRAKERGGAIRQAESRCLALYHARTLVALREDDIAESHIAVAHPEDNVHYLLVSLTEMAHRTCCLNVNVTLLYVAQSIVGNSLFCLTFSQRETLREVLFLCGDAKW